MTARRMLLLVALASALPLSAADLAAGAIAHDAFQLTVPGSSVSRRFVVDNTPSLTIVVSSPSRTLHVAVLMAAGALYTIGTTQNATFSSAIVNLEPRGASYLATIANPRAGNYTLIVSDTAPFTAPVDVVSTIYFNNTTRVVLAGGGRTYAAGAKVRLALVAFDGEKKLNGLSVTGLLFRPGDPSFTPAAVSFRDDGQEGDEKANDGIYGAIVSPASPGTYQVQTNVSGTASTGSFTRTAAASLTFAPRRAQITGFTTRDADADFDGRIERLIVAPAATVTVPGKYRVVVTLRASNGREVTAAAEPSLNAGSTATDVVFDASALVGLGVSGPYTLSDVRYYAVLETDVVVADVRTDLGRTPFYSFEELEQPALRRDGVTPRIHLATNAEGRVTTVTVSIQVMVGVPGVYTWSGSLVDAKGNEIAFSLAGVDLPEGRASLPLFFQGKKIGLHGADGPYYVMNFVVYGEGHSLYVEHAFTTPAYDVSIFEGGSSVRRRAVRP